MGLLKRFFSFYNNVVDIHNIDVITRKESLIHLNNICFFMLSYLYIYFYNQHTS